MISQNRVKQKLFSVGLAGLVSLSSCVRTNDFFSANYWKDLNGDGWVATTEIIGVKSDFSTEECITFYFHKINTPGGRLDLRLYDSIGKLIREECWDKKISRTKLAGVTYPPREFEPGQYIGRWFINYAEIGSTTINVIDNNRVDSKK